MTKKNTDYIEQIEEALAKVIAACPVDYRVSRSYIDLQVNNRGTRSWGGRRNRRPAMSIKPAYLDNDKGTGGYHYNEYKAIRRSNVIGEFVSRSFSNSLLALVAHEYAHLIQYNATRNAAIKHNVPETSFRIPHGRGWQAVYEQLRVNLNLTTRNPEILEVKINERA